MEYEGIQVLRGPPGTLYGASHLSGHLAREWPRKVAGPSVLSVLSAHVLTEYHRKHPDPEAISAYVVPQLHHTHRQLEEVIVTAQKRDGWNSSAVVVTSWKRARRELIAAHAVTQALQELSRQAKSGNFVLKAAGTDAIIERLASELDRVTRALKRTTVLLRSHLRCIRRIERQIAGTKLHQTLLHMLARRVQFRRRVHGLKPGITCAVLTHSAASRYDWTDAMRLRSRIITPQSFSRCRSLGMNMGSSLLAEAAMCA